MIDTTRHEELVAVRAAAEGALEDLVLLVGVCEGEDLLSVDLPEDLRGPIADLVSRSGFSGRKGERVHSELPGEGGLRAVLAGLGEPDGIHPRKRDEAVADLVCSQGREHRSRLALALSPTLRPEGRDDVARLARVVALARYRFRRFIGESGPRPPALPESVLLVPETGREGLWEEAIRFGAEVAESVAFARDLANTPPNVATPEWMAERAMELTRDSRLSVTVLGQEELESRGCGGILAVGSGSTNPPRLVRVDWDGGGSDRIALVGKGITFDTGGISIKPSKAMDEMKFDKCGACAALGTMDAAQRLELPLRLTAWIPFAENMPDGRSYRPGDILTTYDGTTVEVLNTDAEGRLVLADALAMAAEEEPDVLIETSTLTGACVVALGLTGAGLYCPDDGLAEALLASAEGAGERLWRMPLWPEFRESIEGRHADLKNVAGRWGGASVAGAFLSHFVRSLDRWAHLDIAGPAAIGADGDGPFGATGYGVPLLASWLSNLSGER